MRSHNVPLSCAFICLQYSEDSCIPANCKLVNILRLIYDILKITSN